MAYIYIVYIYIFNTSWILGLLLGSTYNNYDINYLILVENLSGIGLYYPLTILSANPCNDSALNGGFNAHNSYNIIPNDHISVLNE